MPHSDGDAAAPRLLTIVNARVWIGDQRRPWADAVLIRGDTIDGVGGSAEMRKRAGKDARVIDARGRLVLAMSNDGTVARGRPADLIVVDRVDDAHVTDAPPPRHDDAEVVLRIEGGNVVFDRDTVS
jgi:predicted amidohydrolase YtcJ